MSEAHGVEATRLYTCPWPPRRVHGPGRKSCLEGTRKHPVRRARRVRPTGGVAHARDPLSASAWAHGTQRAHSLTASAVAMSQGSSFGKLTVNPSASCFHSSFPA